MLADALTKEDYETPNLPPNTVPGPTPIVIQAELTENDNHGSNAIIRYNIMYYSHCYHEYMTRLNQAHCYPFLVS